MKFKTVQVLGGLILATSLDDSNMFLVQPHLRIAGIGGTFDIELENMGTSSLMPYIQLPIYRVKEVVESSPAPKAVPSVVPDISTETKAPEVAPIVTEKTPAESTGGSIEEKVEELVAPKKKKSKSSEKKTSKKPKAKVLPKTTKKK